MTSEKIMYLGCNSFTSSAGKTCYQVSVALPAPKDNYPDFNMAVTCFVDQNLWNKIISKKLKVYSFISGSFHVNSKEYFVTNNGKQVLKKEYSYMLDSID